MGFARLFTALSACILLAACADTTSPSADGLLAKKGQKDQPVSPETTEETTQEPSQFVPHILRQGPAAPSLETYHFEFWATRGATSTYRVEYLPDIDGEVHHFLKLEIPSEALLYRTDGSSIEYGDSILIGVSIDEELLLVQFEPHGLIFADHKPIKLRIYYSLADADYNGDGKVDKKDASIERHELGFAYQPHVGAPWTKRKPEDRSLKNKWFQLTIRHFSNYAVAW